MTETLTVEVPTSLFVEIKKRAAQAHRSVEDEVIGVLAATMPQADA